MSFDYVYTAYYYLYSAEVTVRPEYKTNSDTFKRDLAVDEVNVLPNTNGQKLSIKAKLGEVYGSRIEMFCQLIRYIVGDDNLVEIVGTTCGNDVVAEMYFVGKRNYRLTFDGSMTNILETTKRDSKDMDRWCEDHLIGKYSPMEESDSKSEDCSTTQ